VLKCIGDFTKKSCLAATLMRGYHRHSNNNIAGCVAFSTVQRAGQNHNILPVQFMCLTVFLHNFSQSFLWSASWLEPSTSYSIHFFAQPLSSFHSTCPYHQNLFCCSTEIMPSNPSHNYPTSIFTIRLLRSSDILF